MAIQTSIQPFTLWRNLGFALLCAVFAVWGWYDYEYKIPRLERDARAHALAKDTVAKLTKAAETGAQASDVGAALDESEWDALRKDYPAWPILQSAAPAGPERLKGLAIAVTADIKERYGSTAPGKPASYDRDLQLYLYVVGCGVLGVPSFLWPVIRTSRRSYRMDDDGTLHTPDGVIRPDEIVDIDMSRWCSTIGDRRSTWTAKAVLKDGRRVLLDDHDNRNMHLIIGAIANRIHPNEWTVEAKRIDSKVSKAEPTA